MRSLFILTITTLLSVATHADDVNQRLNSLGGNKALIKKAKALDANNKIRIVQNRAVDRTWRLEMGVNYGLVSGGDPYIESRNYGGNIDLHINPRWSVGARYTGFSNELTSEGKRVFANSSVSSGSGSFTQPEVAYLENSTMGILSFYPVYGKLNMFDMGVAQFDLYVLGGYGQVQYTSQTKPNQSTSSWTAGGGVGLWLSQNFSSRLEVRYQSYQDEIYTGTRDQDLVMANFSIGFLL